MWPLSRKKIATRTDAPRAQTVDEALVILRDALERDGHNGGDGGDVEPFRVSLQSLSLCAQQEQMTPERLLVRLKETLASVPVFDDRARETRDELRSRIVSLVIDEYYTKRQ